MYFLERFSILSLIEPQVEWQGIEQQANLESWKINDWALLIHGKKFSSKWIANLEIKSEWPALQVNAVECYHIITHGDTKYGEGGIAQLSLEPYSCWSVSNVALRDER